MVAQVDRRFTKLSIKKSYTRYLSYLLYEGRPLTTKGRWINPLIFFLYRLQSVMPCKKRIEKPVFILGTGRSGTTILGVTLAMHHKVGFLNEPKALWSFLYHEEDLIGSYQKQEGRYRLYPEDVTSQMKKKAQNIYGNYLRFACASRVVDKYPELIFRTEFVTEVFPDACFLFLYRNGYDTCHSIKKWSERLGMNDDGEVHDWWGKNDRKWKLLCEQIVAFDDVLGSSVNEIASFRNHEHRAAVEWIVTMKEGLLLLKDKPEKVFGVKYENYVGSSNTRREVLEFCNLSADGRYNYFCQDVLKSQEAKPVLDLPTVIQSEFKRVMELLGYE